MNNNEINSNSLEMGIYGYASKINPNCLTYCDVFNALLANIDCVVCLESAADLLGYSNGGFRKNINIYIENNIDLPYLNCIVVDDISLINSIDYNGLRVTPIENAIVEMLSREETDPQILYETFANYYCEHGNTYENLYIPISLEEKAEHFKMEGKRYYEQ